MDKAKAMVITVISALMSWLGILAVPVFLMVGCNVVAVRDDSAEGILKKFLATKRVEGIADSTLQRYGEINRALINYLGKPLEEITAYDLRFYLSVRRQIGKVSNRSLDGMRRCYSSFFSWLAAEGLISHNRVPLWHRSSAGRR